jgi:transcriptional regulator with XRE-family HTH domain
LEKGLTRADFAERLGIDLSTLDDYESGKRTPDAKELDAIKAIYGTELSIPAPAEATGPETSVAVEPETGETAEEAVAEEEGAEEPDAGEADDEAVAEEEDTEKPATGEADEEAVAEEEDTEEADASEEADGEAVAEEEDTEEAEASEEVDEEEAALIAAALKEARKAEKKARKAEKLAARQKADEEATQRVIDIISLLSGSVGLKDRDTVTAARDAYDSLTDDQELMIPGDVLRLLFGAEQRIEDAEDAAAREAAKSIPIEECEITVKDVTFNGKKIKKPSVKVVCGETVLEPGEDYKLKYDKKISEIGLYTLTVKGKGRFTGSVRIPFYVVPKASEYARLLGCDRQAAKEWKLLKNIEGYQIEYSQSKDFSDGKKAKIREPKDLEKALRKLKPGKKYHLRVRLFARVKKKNHYSDWSKVGTVKM